jgi:hypothetical protein
MNYGEDYVSARLAIDIPDNATQGLREITEAVNNFRVAMEQAIHAEGDVSQYLNNMAEAATRAASAQGQLTTQLQNFLATAGRSMMMPGGMMGVPGGGYTQPFMGGTGMTGGYGYSQRPPSPTDAAYQTGGYGYGGMMPGYGMPGYSPHAYLNAAQQRGMVTAQDAVSLSQQTIQDLANQIANREKALEEQWENTDTNSPTHIPLEGGPGTESAVQRISRAAGIAGQVAQEMGPGGSTRGMMGLGIAGLNWAARRYGGRRRPGAPSGPAPPGDTSAQAAEENAAAGDVEDAGGGAAAPQKIEGAEEVGDKAGGILGTLKGLLKPLAGFATAATAIFGAVEVGGHAIQGARNIASLRGGAAGEGFEVEARAKWMAMNPFITQDQARQIYQSVMGEGYANASGAGADNVISFMQHNLTTMNMSVAESTKMLRSTIVGTGGAGDKESVAGAVNMLGQELEGIRTLSKQGVMSQPDYRASVQSLQDRLMAAGASPGGAMRSAMEATQIGAGSQTLKDQVNIAESGLASPAGAMMLQQMGGVQLPPDLDILAAPGWLADTGQLQAGTTNLIRHIALDNYNIYQLNAANPDFGHRAAVMHFQLQLSQFLPGHPAGKNAGMAKSLYDAAISGELSKMTIDAAQDVAGQNMPSGDYGAPPTPDMSPYINPAAVASMPKSGRSQGAGGAPVAQPPQTINVQVALNPDAAKLLTVLGPQAATIKTNQQGSNRGMGGFQDNGTYVGSIGG